jgi:hypothetical protein
MVLYFTALKLKPRYRPLTPLSIHTAAFRCGVVVAGAHADAPSAPDGTLRFAACYTHRVEVDCKYLRGFRPEAHAKYVHTRGSDQHSVPGEVLTRVLVAV